MTQLRVLCAGGAFACGVELSLQLATQPLEAGRQSGGLGLRRRASSVLERVARRVEDVLDPEQVVVHFEGCAAAPFSRNDTGGHRG